MDNPVLETQGEINQSLQQQQPIQPPQNKSNIYPKWILLSITAISLLIIIFGGVYFFSTKNNQQSPQQVAVKYTPTPIPDETANWKTYINTKYNFSLRYPPEWVVKEDTDNIGEFSIESPDYQYDENNKVSEEVKTGAKISFNVLSQNNYSEPKEGEVPTQYFDTINNKQITSIISDISELQINGRDAIKYDRQRSGKYPLMEVVANIHEGAMIYQLRMMYASLPLKETFDQMFSTFKFLK